MVRGAFAIDGGRGPSVNSLERRAEAAIRISAEACSTGECAGATRSIAARQSCARRPTFASVAPCQVQAGRRELFIVCGGES
eukprot:7580164-Lingulodinium_polyedra.AAC.1